VFINKTGMGVLGFQIHHQRACVKELKVLSKPLIKINYE
jgi:hypothetical protein